MTLAPSLAASAARGSLVTLVGQAVRIGTQFAAIAVLARLLDPVDYGYLAMVLAVIGVAELLRDFGLSAAAVQSKELSQAQQSNLFWLNTLVGAAASVLVLGCAPLVALGYAEPALTPITRAMAPVFLLNGMATQFRAHLNRQLRFVALAVSDVLPQLAAFGVAIGCAVSGAGYWALVAQQIAVAVVGLVVSVAVARWRPSRPRRRVPLRAQLRFGGNLLSSNLMTYGVNNVPLVLIGALWGAGVVGFFSRAYQLMALPLNQIVAPLTKVALPVLSRVMDEPERYGRIVARAQLLGLYLTAPLFVLCCTLAKPLTSLALGPQWAPTAVIFGVLALGGAFRAMSQLAHWIFLSSGSTSAQLKLNALSYPLLVALMAAGLPWQGLGVAVGHTVGYALYWPVSLRVACRAAGVSFAPLARTAARVVTTVGLGVLAVSTMVVRAGWSDLTTVAVAVLAAAAWVALVTAVLPAGRADARTLAQFARALRR